MQTDLSEAQEKIKANTSSITQNADKISFMVTGDKESEFTVTDKFIQMISDHISIDASTIDINGIITAMNTHTGPGKTKIDGGIIETNTITADSIKVDAIRSKIFEDDLTSNYSLSIGATANPYACIYVDAIYLTGDKKAYTSLANLGNGGTTNYNGLTNKPKINNVELASGNNTLSNLGIVYMKRVGHLYMQLFFTIK